MKVGTLCFATTRGLGYLAKSFYDNGIITHPAVLNHGSIPTQTDWYPDAPYITTRPYLNHKRFVEEVIDEVDAMLFFETPFDWNIIQHCRNKGIKTILMTMYECTPTQIPYPPDYYFCPSELDMQYFPDNSELLPVPVDVPWNQREYADVFVHNSGFIGLRERNGTRQVLEAMEFVESPLTLIVRSQNPKLKSLVESVPYRIDKDARVKVEIGTISYDDLLAGADVCVAPEKFNGLSLPLQEARAAGLLVMTTDRFPANTWLPKGPLIPVVSIGRARVAGRCLEFDESTILPRDLAKKMDEWYGKDISDYSLAGKFWAEEMSWDVIKPRYLEAIERVIRG